jgi:hypothetical protein
MSGPRDVSVCVLGGSRIQSVVKGSALFKTLDEEPGLWWQSNAWQLLVGHRGDSSTMRWYGAELNEKKTRACRLSAGMSGPRDVSAPV